MKFRYLLIVLMVLFFCKKESGTTSSYTRMEPITLRVVVTNSDDQPFTNGFVKMDALVGLARSFGGWQLEGREETNALSQSGVAVFNFSAVEIIPSMGFITIRNLEVLNRTLQPVYSDTTDFTIDSGDTRTVNFTIE
ncbi:hypothetical protein ACFL4T_10790 [candidate division KSB1 bacterium]